MEYKLEAACGSNIGKIRGNNEDNFYFDGMCMPKDNHGTHDPLFMAQPVKRGLCLAVFDGMGGENYGEYASFAAAKKLKGLIEAPQEFYFTEKTRLLNIAEKLNLAVVDQARELLTSRMGTTMAALYFTHSKVYCCNVGDSRVFRLRDSVFQQLSVDHVSQRPMPAKKKPPLTQHLGMAPEDVRMEPYIAKGELASGDWYLICSDGLTDMVSNLEITQILQSNNDVEKNVGSLINAALNNGGRDNITVILCKIL